MELPRGSQIGPYPYKLIAPIGRGEGGMSHIYLATTSSDFADQSLWVAIKIANVQSEHHQFHRDTLDNEIEHLRRLQHPGIVKLHRIQGYTLPPNPVYSAQTTLEGKPWFSVMEYLSGGSLADLLKKNKQLDIGLALTILNRLAATFRYIHGQGFVHLDLKPENIVFRRPISKESIDPVLIDFGIARGRGQIGLEAGTLQWSPPERIIHSENRNMPPETMSRPHPSMDVYALGLLLYRMVTNRLPFSGSRKTITSAILRGTPTAPSHYQPAITPELEALILSAISREPEDRPSIQEVADHTELLLEKAPYRTFSMPTVSVGTAKIALDDEAPRARSRPIWLLPVVALVALMLVGAVLFNQMGNGGTDQPSRAVTLTANVVIPVASATASPTRSATPQRTATPLASATPNAVVTSTRVPTSTAPPTATAAPPTATRFVATATAIPFVTWTPTVYVAPTSPPAPPTNPVPTNPAPTATIPPVTFVPPTFVPPTALAPSATAGTASGSVATPASNPIQVEPTKADPAGH
ncbi:MAG: serine/threonine protein kinase [Anaerolineales bacterium]|nr:serine/threonine protein kinase [Anaerolineales bacterium]MCB9126826.1 serine/threonine protein kinase [Ardenticatenales bacterium]